MTEPTDAPAPTQPTAVLPEEAIRRFAQIRDEAAHDLGVAPEILG